MKIFGYPRSGNHLLMRCLWLTYHNTNACGYQELFGSHFDAPACTPSPGNPPRSTDEGVAIVRDSCAVVRSIWNMREWFGLKASNSFEGFLSRTYAESYRPGGPVQIWLEVGRGPETLIGGDPMFSEIHERPLEHHSRYVEEIQMRWKRVVLFEQLIATPESVIKRIGKWFGLPGTNVVVPSTLVGFNIPTPAELRAAFYGC